MATKVKAKPHDPIAECEAALGHVFNDRNLLVSALTHTSGAIARDSSNERMEFLGDAVLGLVVCEELFHEYPDFQEGEMTQVKSIVVSRNACAVFAESFGLEKYLILGRGVRHSKLPLNMLADAFESLVAAVYLDSDYATARDFVLRFLRPEIDRVLKEDLLNSTKSKLQMIAQRDFGSMPNYRILDEQGPDHARSFQIVVEIGHRRFEPAWGASKKKAESQAAQNAIDELEGRGGADACR